MYSKGSMHYSIQAILTLSVGNIAQLVEILLLVGRLVVVIDVNPSHEFWTARLMKVFGHEGQCTCIYNTHEWIVHHVVSHGMWHVTWILMVKRRNEFLKMTK